MLCSSQLRHVHGRSSDSPTGGANNLSPFRQWLQGQEPWWATCEEEGGRPMPAHPQGEMGGSEGDSTSHAGSALQDGVQHHDASAPQPYHYFVVSSLLAVECSDGWACKGGVPHLTG